MNASEIVRLVGFILFYFVDELSNSECLKVQMKGEEPTKHLCQLHKKHIISQNSFRNLRLHLTKYTN